MKKISRPVSPAPSQRAFRKYLERLARELFSACPETLAILVDLTRSGIRDVRKLAIKMCRADAMRLTELTVLFVYSVRSSVRSAASAATHAINAINRFLADIEARPSIA
jgi:hypothetical protein